MQEPDYDDLGKRVVGLVADHSQRAVAGYFWALFEAVPVSQAAVLTRSAHSPSQSKPPKSLAPRRACVEPAGTKKPARRRRASGSR